MRLCIRVRPGAGRTVVGGRYGEGEDSARVVAVRERAVDGAATEVIELKAPEGAVTDRLRRLLDGPDTGGRF